MMKDRKYRRGIKLKTNNSERDDEYDEEYSQNDEYGEDDYEEFISDDEDYHAETTPEDLNQFSTTPEPSIFSQLLWNSYLKKTKA